MLMQGHGYPSDHLHAVWDSGIVTKARGQTDWWTYAGILKDRITSAMRKEWLAVPRSRWAQESYDITILAVARYCRWNNNECRRIMAVEISTWHTSRSFRTTSNYVCRRPACAWRVSSEAHFIPDGLVSQGEGEECVTGSDADVLFAVDLIGHRSRGDLASEARLPQKRARFCIERVEVSFAAARE